MTRNEVIASIVVVLKRVVEDKGEPLPEITADTPFLGGQLPIDSLDLATIVVELDIATGLDPFALGFIEFRTVGELADLYSSAADA